MPLEQISTSKISSHSFFVDETLPYLTSVIEVEGGNDFSCAENPMEVFCWGSDVLGQLGTSSFSVNSNIARQVFDLDDALILCRLSTRVCCEVKWENGLLGEGGR